MRPTTLRRQFVLAQRERDCRLSFHLCAQLLGFALLLMLPGVSVAQETKRPGSAAEREEVGPGDIVRIDTDLVPVEVTVRNASGQAVRGLNVSDFKLFVDEVLQPISFFTAETLSERTPCALDLI